MLAAKILIPTVYRVSAALKIETLNCGYCGVTYSSLEPTETPIAIYQCSQLCPEPCWAKIRSIIFRGGYRTVTLYYHLHGV